MSVISIQSHVVYGYVGNKAAVYPLQSMGIDVWPINTVQFSSHAGYEGYKGQIFSSEHIRNLIDGLEYMNLLPSCEAVLSGYMGSSDICEEVFNIVDRVKNHNKDAIYLCDPVIGGNSCYVKQEVLDFFKTRIQADIITPNQFEAEILSGIKISEIGDLEKIADYFHRKNIGIVIITGIELGDSEDKLQIFLSEKGFSSYLVEAKKYSFAKHVNGSGDLFSALFLGHYLLSKDSLESLRKSVYYSDLVLRNTILSEDSELHITSISYQEKIFNNLPRFVKL